MNEDTISGIKRAVSRATKKCPFCAEEILTEAIKCRYCHEFLISGEPTVEQRITDREALTTSSEQTAKRAPSGKFRIQPLWWLSAFVATLLIVFAKVYNLPPGAHVKVAAFLARSCGVFTGCMGVGIVFAYIIFRVAGRSQRAATIAFLLWAAYSAWASIYIQFTN